MTSRFGKTYSRKGGEGTSKFDEVLSTKRGTLSTKWGDTTYKAKVGSKRAGAPKNDSVLEVYKRPRPCGDGLEDPFGFDSDEESKPVSSRSGSKSSPAKPSSAEPPQAERPGVSLDTGSRSSLHAMASAQGVPWLGGDRNQSRIVEDTAQFFNSSSAAYCFHKCFSFRFPFSTEQHREKLGFPPFLCSQPVAVSVVAFSLTCPQLSVTAAGHLPETRATPTDSQQQAVPQ